MNNKIGSPIYQTGVASEILKHKLIEGRFSIRDLLKRGNFGIGTTHLFLGEVIFYQGKAFHISPEGNGSLFDEDALVPFAVVTNLLPGEPIPIEKEMSYHELCEFISGLFKVENAPYTIHIEGYFKEVTVRSLKGVIKEKIDLKNMNENRFTYKNVRGAMIGYFLPDCLSALTTVGFHFHFLDEENMRGGHLYDAQPIDIKITIQLASEFSVAFFQMTDN